MFYFYQFLLYEPETGVQVSHVTIFSFHSIPKILFCICYFPGHDIVASFMLEKPVSLLEDHTLQLEDEILDEISVSGTKVFPIILLLCSVCVV